MRLIPVAGTLPLPTIKRDVSGNVKRTRTRHRPPRIDRNQNIHVHPSFEAMIPPKTGPSGGATFGLF